MGRPAATAVPFRRQGRLYEDLYRAYFNLGNIHLREGEHSGALRCLARARDCARRMKEKALESECCGSTAQVGAEGRLRIPPRGFPPPRHPGGSVTLR